ncbi:MAG TPA: hypothetical protein VGF25_21210 [Thermoleophilaceae bacterium]
MLLNCASTTTAFESLAAAAGVPPHDVHTALTAIDWTDLEEHNDPERALPQLAAERLGRHLGGFSEVRYFHGTRTRDADSFRRHGLLPLGAALEGIWRELREIGADQLGDAEFETLRTEIEGNGGGDGGRLYRLKTPALQHHGPFAEYVREHFLHPQELSSHDYLRTPELVEDIAHAAEEMFDVDLLAAYTAATKPCIVAFDMPMDDDGPAIEATCWYLWAAARRELTRAACGGFDGQGVAVPPTAIRDVEIIDVPW